MNNVAAHVAPPPDGRRQPRTHLFVAATLHAGGGAAPVNIRNMSPSGALIEAPRLPEPGAEITLVRGRLRATGRMAWRVSNRAGVKFDAAVRVAEWMARPGGAGQQRVDEMVGMIRNEGVGAAAGGAEAVSPASLQSELLQLRAELSELESGLIGDVILVATHPEIQTIDIAVQRIDRILRRFVSPD